MHLHGMKKRAKNVRWWRVTGAATTVLLLWHGPAAFAASNLDLLGLQVFAKQSISAERSDYQGPAAAGGVITLSDFQVDGDLTGGTGVAFNRGQVGGFVRSPDVRLSHVFSSGAEPVDGNPFEIASLKLDLIGARLAALPQTAKPTIGTSPDGKTEVRATAQRDLEVIDLSGDRLTAPGEDRTRLALNGDAHAQLLVRVHGRSVSMRHLAFSVSGGLDPSRIVLFFPEATDLEIAFSGGATQDNGESWNIPGSIVAPDATLRFAASTITGQVFARSIVSIPGQPGGQVDRLPPYSGQTGHFTPSQLLQGIGTDQFAAMSPLSNDAVEQSDDIPGQAGCRRICTPRTTLP